MQTDLKRQHTLANNHQFVQQEVYPTIGHDPAGVNQQRYPLEFYTHHIRMSYMELSGSHQMLNDSLGVSE